MLHLSGVKYICVTPEVAFNVMYVTPEVAFCHLLAVTNLHSCTQACQYSQKVHIMAEKLRRFSYVISCILLSVIDIYNLKQRGCHICFLNCWAHLHL